MKIQQGIATAGLVLSLIVHTACDPLTLATTAGGVVGMSVLEERTTEASYQDSKIQISIHSSIRQNDLGAHNEIFVMVYESEVMLVGFVPDAEDRQRIREIAENTPGVVRLYDDFRQHAMDLVDYGNDRLLGLKLSTQLSLEQGVHAVNYVIRIVDGVAYMMGLALSEEELERVRAVTSSIAGIRGMVSRIRVRDPLMTNRASPEVIEGPEEEVMPSVPVEIIESAPIDHFGGAINVQPLPVLR